LPQLYSAQEKKIIVSVYLSKEKINAFHEYLNSHPVFSIVSLGLSAISLVFELAKKHPILFLLFYILNVNVNAMDLTAQKIVTDPSLNYTQLVLPSPIPETFYKLPNNTESRALLYEYLCLSYLNASVESAARANGAAQMNDIKYYYLQLRNARIYAANASIYYSKLVPLLEQMFDELNRSGYLNEASFIKGQEYIAKNGLPSNVTRLLTELGFTKYINIHDVEERLKNARYESINITKLKETLELTKKYNPAAFFNRTFTEELESISNRTLCEVVLRASGTGNITVKVDGRDYLLPVSFNWSLGTRHNITFSQVISGPSYNYVFKELHVGNETFTSLSYQLDVLEPVSITAVYEGSGSVEPLPPETVSQIYIVVIVLMLILAMILGYIKWGTGKSTYS
jgi:hypothetical protein